MHVKKIRNIESEVQETGKDVSGQMSIYPDEGPNFATRNSSIEPGSDIPSHTAATEHERYVLGGMIRVGVGD